MTATMLQFEDFAAQCGSDFLLVGEEPAVAMTLTEAAPGRRAGPSGRPFTLVFATTDTRLFDQQTFHLHHETLGDVEIFLVPIGEIDGRLSYEAVFN